MKNLLTNKLITILAVIVVIGGIYYAGMYYYQNNKGEKVVTTKNTKTLPSEFPIEVVHPDLILESYIEDTNPDGKERIIADFTSTNLSSVISRDDYKKWIEDLGWKGYAAGSSYTETNGQATSIGFRKSNIDLMLTYHYPGLAEKTELTKISLQITF